MRSRTKRLLLMTGVLSAVTIGYAVWISSANRRGVTVVNRTRDRIDHLDLTFDDDPTTSFGLDPGESRALPFPPLAEKRRIDTSVNLTVRGKQSGHGIGFGANRWARIEIVDRPRNAQGHNGAFHATYGKNLNLGDMLDRFRSGKGVFNSTYDSTFETSP